MLSVELYVSTTITSFLLIIVVVIFQTKFPEIFNKDRPLIELTIDVSEKKKMMIFCIIIILLTIAPLLNYLFALIYATWVIYQIIKYRINR